MAEKPIEKPIEKTTMLKAIQVCCFNVSEAALYLDTHKTDKVALAYFNKHNEMLCELKSEYVKKYGPLSIADNTSATKWEWVDSPWPWELY